LLLLLLLMMMMTLSLMSEGLFCKIEFFALARGEIDLHTRAKVRWKICQE